MHHISTFLLLSFALQYVIGYGGGLLAKDRVSVECVLDTGATVAITTQSTTKVYKQQKVAPIAVSASGSGNGASSKAEEPPWCGQTMYCTISTGALLALVPDPVTCFKAANYRQVQEFRVAAGGSLVLCDWLTSGRMERGEVWDFERFESHNAIYVDDSLVVLDPLVLQDGIQGTVKQRMRGMHAVGMAVFIGPQVADMVAQLLAREHARRQRFSAVRQAGSAAAAMGVGCTGGKIMSSVSPLPGHGAVLRFAAEQTEDAYALLQEALEPLEDILGASPYSNDYY
ncbi:urease accessory protein UreD [Tribonema minus]|uniref:Urease accessory protein UreD n=1 Tax=Tribonema minus TaxID=303371 RepID=A0A835Z1C4_9STRA|nr:urease accessory protein UreD [Tribonema minus]